MTISTDKKSFLLYNDVCKVFDELTDEQAGQLIKELVKYAENKTQSNLEKPSGLFGLLNVVAIPFKAHMDRDFAKWERRANNSKNNGKKGGRPKKNVVENNPEKPVNVNVNVNVNDKVKEKEIKNNLENDFRIFWDNWKTFEMTKGSRKQASEKYAKARKAVDAEKILNAANAYNALCQRLRIKTKHISAWLNQECYNDETPTAKPNNRPTY